jgi:hypothetical protein
MSANSFTIVKNDPRATALGSAERHEMAEMGNLSGGDIKSGDDEQGETWAFGRGVVDLNITYLKLYNTSGVPCYIYPNAAGTGIIVSPTQP